MARWQYLRWYTFKINISDTLWNINLHVSDHPVLAMITQLAFKNCQQAIDFFGIAFDAI